jgi:1-acyl-sn-glycerol-3-phosphate acyltransferase
VSGLHLLRVMLHLLQGLATCALVFPLAGPAMRERRIRNWSRKLLAICGVRLVVKGAISDSPALIVSNHVSWLDIFAVNTCKPCRFVAKSDIRDWPLLGWLCERAGTIFIARGRQRDVRRIFQGLVQSIHAGERVAFFPEGTTALQGTVLPFHANLFEAAIDARVAVQPCALAYLDAEGGFHTAVEYADGITFVDTLLAILSGPPVRARLACLAPLDAAGMHRRDLAQAAHDAVAGALQPCCAVRAARLA